MVSSSLRKCPVILLRIVFILLLLEGGLWVSGLAHIAIYSRNQKEIQKENFVILTIGDSMTLSGEDPWPWQLQRMLNEKYPSLNVMVVSQATAGSNTKEIADKLNSFDWEKYQPKVIVFCQLKKLQKLFLFSWQKTGKQKLADSLASQRNCRA